MTLSTIPTRLQRLRKSALFFLRFHPVLQRSVRAVPPSFITCSGKHDGAGAQALAILSTLLFSHDVGLQYVHTPFTSIQHNPDDDPAWEAKWEQFFNLGKDELSLDHAASSGLEQVRLRNLTDLPFTAPAPNTLFVLKHCHTYANRFPDRYLGIIDTITSKYYSSSKAGLRSYYDRSRLNVAVHVRRGDVDSHGPNASRYTRNDFICALLRDVVSASSSSGLPVSACLYSEGSPHEFGPLQDMDIDFHLNECPFATFHNLVTADVLLMAKSTFSYLAGLYSRGVKIYESFRDAPYDHRPLRDWLVAQPGKRFNLARLRRALGHLADRRRSP